MNYLQTFLTELWHVTGMMSPYLLLGFIVAGVLSVYLPPKWVEAHLTDRGVWSILKAALFGIPIPLCSCGVIPVGLAIRKQGASKGATTSFLLSTPQTGVDSLFATHALMGPFYAVFRALAAFITGTLGGILVQNLGDDDTVSPTTKTEGNSCCDHGCDEHTHANKDSNEGSCCGNSPAKAQKSPIRQILHYGLITLPQDIAGTLLIGIAIAAAISTIFEPGNLSDYLQSGWYSYPLMVLVGLPLYICSTASIPVAAGLILLGASPGAALTFLIAGPATNAATVTTLWKALGKRTALLYLFAALISAIGCGLLLDISADILNLDITGGVVHTMTNMEHGMTIHIWAGALLLLITYSLFAKYVKKPHKHNGSHTCCNTADATDIEVSGITCEHCAADLTEKLNAISGISDIHLSNDRQRLSCRGDNSAIQAALTCLKENGYDGKILDKN